MRILIINWRSIKDVLEGGAERATFEFAKRWVSVHGAEVFWLSPKYKNDCVDETIDGVKFVYVGLPLSRNIFKLMYLFPYFYFSVISTYFTKFRNKIDIVIDQVHGIPYLTPLYVIEKKIIYIHEVAGAIWDLMYPFPINLIGRFFERLFFLPYSDIKFIANSNSTKKDLIEKVKIQNKNIKIINYGVSAPKNELVGVKESVFTVMYLNRIVKMKGIERGLKSFAKVVKKIPQAKLWVVGTGEQIYLNELKTLVNDLNLANNVVFKGFVDGKDKFDLLSRSHVLINPSYLEGWGLVNIEANRMGTPAVVFNVRGSIDSVVDGVNGYICPNDDLDCFSEKIIEAGNNDALRKSAIDYSQKFDWDLQADKFYEELNN